MAVTIDELQIEIQAKGAESANGIDALTTSLAALKKMVNKTLTNKLGELSSALDKIKAPITVNMNVKGMGELKNALDAANSKVGGRANLPTVDGTAVSGELDKISGSAVQAAGELEQLSSPATKVANELRATGNAAGDTGKKLKEVGDSAKKGASGLSKFISSFKRILMYRVVRSILSNIANAAKEGIQNLVLYSKAIGGIDASRANATMSQFASMGMQVKNTLGSALMPVLNALMPVIQTVANWFIIAANAVNQFFAAISGASTWSRAKEYAVDYANGLGKATDAASDLKNAMLGIDELNVISPNSGGGGGAGGGIDYSEMFEEVPTDSKFKETLDAIGAFFSGVWERIKDSGALDRLTESWDKFKKSLERLWKSPATKAIIKWLGEAFKWILALAGILIVDTLADVLTILTDIVELIGAIISGDIAGIVNGIKNTLVDIVALPLGLIADIIDAIFGTDVKGWLDGVVEAVKNFDLAAWFVQAWEDIKSVWNEAPGWFNKNVIQPVVNFFKGLWASVSGFFVNLWNDIVGVWNSVADWFNDDVIAPVVGFFRGVWTSVSGFFSNLWGGIKGVWSTVSGWFNSNVIQPVTGFFRGIWTSVSGFFSNLWGDIKGVFINVGTWFKTNVTDPIANFFKGAINTVIKALNWMIRGLNKVRITLPNWGILGDLAGRSYGINISEISYLASGGLVDAGQLFVARESGPEMVGTMGGRTAVANNDQIVEAVALGVYEAVVAAMGSDNQDDNAKIVINLDGQKIYENQQKIARGKGYNLGMGAFA